MKPNSDFVNGGGWILRQTVGRRKARIFLLLSLSWVVVSVYAGMLMCSSWVELSTFYWWGCILALALHILFVALAVVFHLIEKPLTITKHLPNPDYDAHNLY